MYSGPWFSFAAILFAALTFTALVHAGTDDCGPPPTPPTGGAYLDCIAGNVPSETTCTLTCANGYTKTGTDPECWLGAYSGTGLNDCVPATCAPLSGPIGSSSDCGSAPTGSACLASCNPGYTQDGSGAMTCVGIGVGVSAWAGPPLTCAPNPCPVPPTPPVGGAYPGCGVTNIPSGTTCALTCAPGYTKTGSDPQCVLGSFSAVGSNACVPATCAPLSEVGSSSDCGVAPTGSTCTVGCAPGYDGATRTATCVGTGIGTSVWQDSGSCTSTACASPPTPPVGGSYPDCSDGNVPSGTTCALTCALGYTKTGTDPECVLGVFDGAGSNACTPATCAPLSGPVDGSSNCGSAPTGSACTVTCNSGFTKVGTDPSCVGTAVGTSEWQGSVSCVTCEPAPAFGCRRPTKRGKAILKMKNATANEKDQLQWTWTNGAATTLAEIGDPTTTESYYLCLYDAGVLRSSTRVPAAGTCGRKPCWKARTHAFQYTSKDLAPDGVAQLKLKEGLGGKALIQIKGKGLNLEMPALGNALVGPVTVQLQRAHAAVCWEATYDAPFVKNDGVTFKGKSD